MLVLPDRDAGPPAADLCQCECQRLEMNEGWFKDSFSEISTTVDIVPECRMHAERELPTRRTHGKYIEEVHGN